jgi:membrane-associated phospholipid phosphatase
MPGTLRGLASILARALSLAAKPSRRGRFGLRPYVRGAAYVALAASVAVPLLRRRLKLRPAATVAATVAGPVATATLRPRTKTRDAFLFLQQMWAFVMVHELPYDDADALRRRLKVRYPIRGDRLVGAGRLPNTRLQEWLTRDDGSVSPLDRILSIAHWVWFFEPHLSLIYILVADEKRFVRAARQMGGAFDLGCLVYAAVPTAPPWWASANGYTGDDEVQRRMLAVGEETFGRAWPMMYDAVDGNPWAAMPSLHFGASVLAAILLSESNRTAGIVGWTYAGVLGFALVYLGEHYVVDLLAGLGLVATVRLGEPLAEPLALAVSASVQQLERIANS